MGLAGENKRASRPSVSDHPSSKGEKFLRSLTPTAVEDFNGSAEATVSLRASVRRHRSVFRVASGPTSAGSFFAQPHSGSALNGCHPRPANAYVERSRTTRSDEKTNVSPTK